MADYGRLVHFLRTGRFPPRPRWEPYALALIPLAAPATFLAFWWLSR